jgi:hypothetical protein
MPIGLTYLKVPTVWYFGREVRWHVVEQLTTVALIEVVEVPAAACM